MMTREMRALPWSKVLRIRRLLVSLRHALTCLHCACCDQHVFRTTATDCAGTYEAGDRLEVLRAIKLECEGQEMEFGRVYVVSVGGLRLLTDADRDNLFKEAALHSTDGNNGRRVGWFPTELHHPAVLARALEIAKKALPKLVDKGMFEFFQVRSTAVTTGHGMLDVDGQTAIASSSVHTDQHRMVRRSIESVSLCCFCIAAHVIVTPRGCRFADTRDCGWCKTDLAHSAVGLRCGGERPQGLAVRGEGAGAVG